MDSVALVEFARRLIDVDSTTGREGDVAALLAGELRALGYLVTTQPLKDGRANVIATVGDPVVTFSTHFDCVPPFFPSRIEGGALYGRGSADAKGILAAQVAASERLRRSGDTRVGLLFVAGEERGSDGAQAANTLPTSSKFLINGEPTDNRLAVATRGVYRLRLNATGRAAHSSRPELGESAIDKLIDALVALRDVEWPQDPVLGRTYYTTGLISGGVAPNVISPHASAEVMFRTVGDHVMIRHLVDAAVEPWVTPEDILVVPPVRLMTMDGFETAVFSFTTDIPFLSHWGAPLLLGPGAVEEAHTDHEHVALSELNLAVDRYEQLARRLLD